MIRILVADDEPMLRDVLSRVVAREPSFELVGVAADADQAIAIAAVHHPDVALLDFKMPSGGGPRAAREIRSLSPKTKVLAFSAYEDQTAVLEMLRCGVTGYIVKGTPTDKLVEAIRRVALGEGTISESITSGLMLALGGKLERENVEFEAAREQKRRIRQAIHGDVLTLVFQPIADLRTGRVVGVEALSRFAAEPARPPDVWFAEAAAAGLLVDLELVAVREAMTAMQALPEDVYLSVNVSPETVLSEGLSRALEAVRAGRLLIEITEHAPVEDYDELCGALRGLRERGGRVAVDDACAGFASMRHIVRLAPDVIKLDISLTRGINHDRTRRALAAALISFAEEVDAVMVAEGIENADELETLRSLGVPCGQGYLLGRPRALPVPRTIPEATNPPTIRLPASAQDGVEITLPGDRPESMQTRRKAG